MEVWADVFGYEELYEVSNLGRVAKKESYDQKGLLRPRRLMAGGYNAREYKTVNLSLSGESRVCLVHRLVALEFCEPREGCHEVNHIDGDKLNNFSSNLEWCTKEENLKHAMDMGLIKTAGTIVDNYTVLKMRIIDGKTHKEIADELGVHRSTVSKIIRDKYEHGIGPDLDF